MSSASAAETMVQNVVGIAPVTAPGKSAARRLVERLQLSAHEYGLDVTRAPFRYRVVHAMRLRGIVDVLDIGANIGQFAVAMRRAKLGGRIVSVEPLGAAYEQLVRRAAADAGWAVEHAAVSASPGEAMINVSANSVSS